MFLYRDHRNSLKNSMKTVQEFQNKQELLDYLVKSWRKYAVDLDTRKIKVEWYCYDTRIEWDTHIVTYADGGVFGFTNCAI